MACDVIISYSSAERALAERLEQAIAAAGFAVWRDKNQIRPGGRFPDEIAAAIDSCFAVVWLASVSSVQSQWVRRELEYATNGNKLVIPIHVTRQALLEMPRGLRLLFPHIDYVSLEERGWDKSIEAVIVSLRAASTQAQRALPESPAIASGAPASVGPGDWPDQTGAVETPPDLDLLPIDEHSPCVLGVAIDISGSMQSAIVNDAGRQMNRLEGVLDAVRALAARYRAGDVPPEITGSLGLAKLFAYGFGFADRAAKFGKLGQLAMRLSKDAPPIPSRVFRGVVRDLLEVARLEPHTLSLKALDAQWSLLEQRLWEQRVDFFGATHLRAAMETVAARFATEVASYAGIPHSALLVVSDGESKDGSPLEACRRIAAQGTVILSCYLTGLDVAEPRRFYSRPQPGWPEGALTLFRCASVLEEDSIVLPALREKGWRAAEGDRLFVQLNQSAMVSEFASFIFDLARGRARSRP